MLLGLSIRDLVLIDRLDLPFAKGLCVLTGETGAGKSIVLDSLALVTGARADSAVIRAGASASTVSAEFESGPGHPAGAILSEHGLDDSGDTLILRRVVSRGGRSRAFVNDQSVSVGLLRKLGACLIEIHGQHGEQGLLDGANHRSMVDTFGRLEGERDAVRGAHAELRRAGEALDQARSELEAARRDEAYLRHSAAELDGLDPRSGEEEALAKQRQLGMHGEKLVHELEEVLALFGGDGGIESRLRSALRGLGRAAPKSDGRLDPVLELIERIGLDADEAREALARIRDEFDHDPKLLEAAEERLFALRAVARKHRCQVDDLVLVREGICAELATLDAGEDQVRKLEGAMSDARQSYRSAAATLSASRLDRAQELDRLVMAELAPLKLGKAVFRTRVETLDEQRWGAEGQDRVAFEIATVPGAEPGPLGRIVSGGELSRLMLAIKVVLARQGPAPTLIFDEVDRGIGGAVADAVGERLARLARGAQIVVVTHSPQVAARASGHWRVDRRDGDDAGGTVTTVVALDEAARREEIARMLAGSRITDEARAAAASLIAG